MIARPITWLARLGGAAVLVLLGATALLQAEGAAPAAATGATEGIFEVGIGQAAALQPLPPGVSPVSVSAGAGTLYAIGSDGNLYVWGDDADGELGAGSQLPATNNSSVVVSLPAGVPPTAVAAGPFDAYAIGSDGALYAWGFNEDGELGDGTDTGPDACPRRARPVRTVSALLDHPSEGLAPTRRHANGHRGRRQPGTGDWVRHRLGREPHAGAPIRAASSDTAPRPTATSRSGSRFPRTSPRRRSPLRPSTPTRLARTGTFTPGGVTGWATSAMGRAPPSATSRSRSRFRRPSLRRPLREAETGVTEPATSWAPTATSTPGATIRKVRWGMGPIRDPRPAPSPPRCRACRRSSFPAAPLRSRSCSPRAR